MKIRKILNNKEKGSAGTIIVCLFSLFIMCMFIYLSSVQSQKKTQAWDIDNKFVSSLLGCSNVSLAEYGRTKQIEIASPLSDEFTDTIKTYGEDAYITTSSLFSNSNSQFSVSNNIDELNKAYDNFVQLLKVNLNLDDDMKPVENSALLKRNYTDRDQVTQENQVEVEEFTVINKYKYKNVDGSSHTYTATYRKENNGNFVFVSGLSGVDLTTKINSADPLWSNVVRNGKSDGVDVTDTSVYARLRFIINGGKIYDADYRAKEVKVDRVVSIEQKQ